MLLRIWLGTSLVNFHQLVPSKATQVIEDKQVLIIEQKSNKL